MKELNSWICTDPDSWQYLKKLNDNQFYVIEYGEVGDFSSPFYYLYTSFIDLECYDENDINDYISGYYNSLDEIKEIYGDEANQIIVECIFESMTFAEHDFVKKCNYESEVQEEIIKYMINN